MVNKSNEIHRYGLRIPIILWNKIIDAHWYQRKSINKLIIEILEEKLGG